MFVSWAIAHWLLKHNTLRHLPSKESPMLCNKTIIIVYSSGLTYHPQDYPIVPGGWIAEIYTAPIRSSVLLRDVCDLERGSAAVIRHTDVVIQWWRLFQPLSPTSTADTTISTVEDTTTKYHEWRPRPKPSIVFIWRPLQCVSQRSPPHIKTTIIITRSIKKLIYKFEASMYWNLGSTIVHGKIIW